MKRAFILLALICLAASLAGCPSIIEASPEKKLASAEILLDTTVAALVDLRDAGHIDAALEAKLTPFVEAAYAALLRMRDAIETGAADFEVAWDVFQAAASVLIEEKAKAGGDA